MTVRSYLQQGVGSDDILMSVLSLGHANAQAMCLFSAIGAGATAVFFPRFSASNFFKWARDCEATITNFLVQSQNIFGLLRLVNTIKHIKLDLY